MPLTAADKTRASIGTDVGRTWAQGQCGFCPDCSLENCELGMESFVKPGDDGNKQKKANKKQRDEPDYCNALPAFVTCVAGPPLRREEDKGTDNKSEF